MPASPIHTPTHPYTSKEFQRTLQLFFFFTLSIQQISQFNSDPHYNVMKNVLSYTKKSLTADRNDKTKDSKHKPPCNVCCSLIQYNKWNKQNYTTTTTSCESAKLISVLHNIF